MKIIKKFDCDFSWKLIEETIEKSAYNSVINLVIRSTWKPVGMKIVPLTCITFKHCEIKNNQKLLIIEEFIK